MENLSPSRIQPLAPGEESNKEDPRPLKQAKPLPKVKKMSAAPLVDAPIEPDEDHLLDERA